MAWLRHLARSTCIMNLAGLLYSNTILLDLVLYYRSTTARTSMSDLNTLASNTYICMYSQGPKTDACVIMYIYIMYTIHYVEWAPALAA